MRAHSVLSPAMFRPTTTIVAFLNACYTRKETYTPNPTLSRGVSGGQLETEDSQFSNQISGLKGKIPTDTSPPIKQTHAHLAQRGSRYPSLCFQPLQVSYPSLCPGQCKLLHSPGCIPPPPPPTSTLPTKERTTNGGRSISSGTRPSLSILARKLHFPDSRPLSPASSRGDPASAVLMPAKCPAQLRTPRTSSQAPGTGPIFLPLPQHRALRIVDAPLRHARTEEVPPRPPATPPASSFDPEGLPPQR